MPTFPAPVEPEALAVPADDGGRFDEDQDPAPTWPDTPEPYPEDSIAVLQTDTPLLPLKDDHLLSEGHILKRQIPSAPEPREQAPHRNPDPIPHRRPPSLSRQEASNLAADRVFATHR